VAVCCALYFQHISALWAGTAIPGPNRKLLISKVERRRYSDQI
jgi:hypothetical protein